MSKAGTGSNGYAAIACVLLLAAGLRGTILFAGHRGLRSDEAVVGLMAKHIVTRGETPIFLYGQAYGGGHAIVAYLAAPLFAAFGRSAVLLTGISVVFSLVNIWLVWFIIRRHVGDPFDPAQGRPEQRRMGETAAVLAAALYAFSPPAVYQSYLVNGGTEAFLLAFLALHFFLRSYSGDPFDHAQGRPEQRRMGEALAPRCDFLAGLFGGLAYWAMDYTLLYPVVFGLLWLACATVRPFAKAQGKRALARLAGGFLVGCLPMMAYDAQHDFEHFRQLYAPYAGAASASVGPLEHFFGALWRVLSGDLASFYGGDIDDVHPADWAAWVHAVVAMLGLALLIYRGRTAVGNFLKSRRLPVTLLPAVFVIVYLGMYGVAKFSLPVFRTPRYLLPLCPFLSIAIAIVVAGWTGARKWAGLAVVAFLVAAGAATSLQVGLRDWHEEHRIKCSTAEMAKLAETVQKLKIRAAFAPYQIQWRLMFATDESVLVSCNGITSLVRYPYYEATVWKMVCEDQDFAFIFRRDFAYAQWAKDHRMGIITRDIWRDACRRAGISPEGIPVGDEFVIFYPLKKPFLRTLEDAAEADRTNERPTPNIQLPTSK